jgi:hypothetical protein
MSPLAGRAVSRASDGRDVRVPWVEGRTDDDMAKSGGLFGPVHRRDRDVVE